MIAGPNGSGKTTLTNRHLRRFPSDIEVINPDEIAKEFDPDFVHSPTAAMKAGREALKRQHAYLTRKETFALETTFSGNREQRLLALAKEAGFKTNLIYISLTSPTLNIGRVAERVSAGGHYIPEQDIIRRYARSMRNAPLGLANVDRAFVVDNSLLHHRILFSLKNDRMRSVTPEHLWPEWVKDMALRIGDCKRKMYATLLGEEQRAEFLSTTQLALEKTCDASERYEILRQAFVRLRGQGR